jgi:hypothetical protein
MQAGRTEDFTVHGVHPLFSSRSAGIPMEDAGARRRSTGPRTAEGLARSRRARWKHGLYSAQVLAEQKRLRELLSETRALLKQMKAG